MMEAGRKSRQKRDFDTWTSWMGMRDTVGEEPYWRMYIASRTIRWRELSPLQYRNIIAQGSCIIIESLVATHLAGLQLPPST